MSVIGWQLRRKLSDPVLVSLNAYNCSKRLYTMNINFKNKQPVKVYKKIPSKLANCQFKNNMDN